MSTHNLPPSADWRPQTYVDEVDRDTGEPRQYAALREHPNAPGRWLAWLIKRPEVQASGARAREAMDRLCALPGVAVRVRFVDNDSAIPLPARITVK